MIKTNCYLDPSHWSDKYKSIGSLSNPAWKTLELFNLGAIFRARVAVKREASVCLSHYVFLTTLQKIILARVLTGPGFGETPAVEVRLMVGPADSILRREQNFDESWDKGDDSFTIDSNFDDYQFAIIYIFRLWL